MRHESPHRGPRIPSGRAQTPRRTASAGGSRTQSSPHTIGKLAALTQVSADTLRYYEREHLLQPRGKSSSGYRLYDEEAARRVQFIRHAQECGFTLAEIRELLTLRGRDSACCDDVRRVALPRRGKIPALARYRRGRPVDPGRALSAQRVLLLDSPASGLNKKVGRSRIPRLAQDDRRSFGVKTPRNSEVGQACRSPRSSHRFFRTWSGSSIPSPPCPRIAPARTPYLHWSAGIEHGHGVIS